VKSSGTAFWNCRGGGQKWEAGGIDVVLGFEQRDAPQYLKRNMAGQIRRWHNILDRGDKKRKADERPEPRGGRDRHWQSNTAWALGGGSAGAGAGSATATQWGCEPAGGWTSEQQNRWNWNGEEKTRKVWAKDTKERVAKEVDELRLRRNPEAVSKKTAAAIGRMGVRTGRGVVAKMTAKAVAYRTRMGTQKGKEIFQDRALGVTEWGCAQTGGRIRSQRVSDAQKNKSVGPGPRLAARSEARKRLDGDLATEELSGSQ
jgi:hypothetical protein